MQVLAGPETRQEPFEDLDSLSSSRVACGARRTTRDRECAEAAQLDTISAGKGAGYLGEDGFDDPHDVAMWQARIELGNPCDELALGQMTLSGLPPPAQLETDDPRWPSHRDCNGRHSGAVTG